MLFALGMLVLTRKRVQWGDDWVWPVPRIRVRGRVYAPVITSGFYDMREDGPHGGLDIVFPRKDPSDLIDLFRPGTPNGGRNWFAPPRTPIVAARAGKLWTVGQSDKGIGVILDHGKPFATFYQHMESSPMLGVAKGTHVNMGDVIGYMGYSNEDAQRVRHLHFAVMYEGGLEATVDSEQAMRVWPYVTPIYDIAG